MASKWSRTLIPTSRQVPGDAEVPSHQLMLRAGVIHKLGSGVYDYLPLGWRALQKTMAIIREEMDRAGATEVFLPTLQPVELWERSGRRADYGEVLFVVKDRHGREHALGPTHEEVITELVATYVDSYKQLPLTLYQIQTKFRDEYRPRYGVLRSREFQMKDAYSFDTSIEGLEASYQAMYDAYCRIFERCGLPYQVVEAESGPIGGSASHEFIVPSPTGEDTILESDKGNYAANVEKCEIGQRPQTLDGAPTGELEKVHTPSCTTIEEVGTLLKVDSDHLLKTLVYTAASPGAGNGAPRIFVAVVRGDHDVNEAKLRSAVAERFSDVEGLALADERQARAMGYEIGYVGPHEVARLGGNVLLVDCDAAAHQFWVTGANERDHHVRHFNWKRDVTDRMGENAKDRLLVADIRNAIDGDPSPKDDGGVLRARKGIEIGHVFKLGTRYTQALEADVLDEKNQRAAIIMGCYGIGVNRILAAAIERQSDGKMGHDADGIIWPPAIAPYSVLITPIKYEGAVKEAADRLVDELEDVGLDVLLDDRSERPGVKFKDADLIGIPLRITVGDKGLKEGKVEVKLRTEQSPQFIGLDEAAQHAAEQLGLSTRGISKV